jgi:AraC-like DNA-binding protein
MNAIARNIEFEYNFPENHSMKIHGMPFQTYKDLKEKIQQFEQEKAYLSKGVSLPQLAKDFGTNYSYLSRVINSSKGKNFSKYINELRLVFIYRELKNNPVYRRYTIKAIGEEIGFGSAECFSKSFYMKFGLYPSEYLKNLT